MAKNFSCNVRRWGDSVSDASAEDGGHSRRSAPTDRHLVHPPSACIVIHYVLLDYCRSFKYALRIHPLFETGLLTRNFAFVVRF